MLSRLSTRYFTCFAASFLAVALQQTGAVFSEETAAEKQKKLIAVLESPDAPPQDKAISCKLLARCGDKDAVPALAALLSDEKLAAWARIALEAIPDPACDEALLAAAANMQGRLLVGVVNSIGMRRSPGAVDVLAKLLNAEDAEAASSAAVALGRIGGDEAAQALEKSLASAPAAVRSAVAEGCILCAERSLKAGNAAVAVKLYDAVCKADVPKQRVLEATRGAILARKTDGIPLLLELLRSEDKLRFELGLWVAREIPGREATDALVAALDGLAPERQALLVLALTDRAERPPTAVVARAAKSGPKSVRIAAIKFLQRQGDVSCVPVLLAAAVETDAELSAVAAEALAELSGKDVDAELAAQLPKAEGKTRLVLIELVGQRRIETVASDLLKASDDADGSIRAASLKALGATIDFASLPLLIDRVAQAKTPEDMAATADALKAASSRMPDREACAEKLASATAQAPAAAKCKLLESLGAVGGSKALAAIAEASKDAEADVQGAAIQQLGAWMTPDAAPALLELAKNAVNDKYKVRALRGYLRIARQFVVPADERLAMFNAAMEVAQRDEERCLALEVLTRIPSVETLGQATARLGDDSLKDAAADVAVKIAAKLAASEPKAAAEAMQKVLDADVGNPLKERARQVLDQANAATKPPKFITHRVGTFRSEACCVGDFNNDGKIDIAAGPFLYLAPDWKPRKIRELAGAVDENGKGYYDDFMNAAVDVDGDGLLDIISCGWFSQSSFWYRNIGEAEGLWPERLIEKNGNFETAGVYDLKGTGRRNVLVPFVSRTVWGELASDSEGKRSIPMHIVSEKGMAFGVGVGDLNGDGRPDILRPNAWFETPADLVAGKWIEHPLGLGGKDGRPAHTAQILVHDVNGDKLPDIIASSAHGHGIFWYEQQRSADGKTAWRQHTIDDTWSQAHSLTLADLDGDGSPELITGKRFMAHNGNDPDAFGPLGVYYYKLRREPTPAWTKHVISFNEGIGAGQNIEAADLNGDGRLDIVVTGKWGGPVWFENLPGD